MTSSGSGWELPEKGFLWIEENIPFGSRIVELGSGDGSNRLSEHYELWSIEHDENWIGLCPCNYIHAEVKPYSKDGEDGLWYNPEKIKNALPDDYSLIIIDGPPSTIGRRGILSHQELFNWNCYVLVDDTHRPEEKEISDILCAQHSLKQTQFTEFFEKTGVNREFTILSRR